MNTRIIALWAAAMLLVPLSPLTPLAAHAAAPKVYVGVFKDNTVAVIDTGTNKVLKTIPVPAGPHGLVVAPDGRRVYVSSDGATTVSVIDTASDKIVQNIEVGKTPHGLALTPDGKRLLVGVFGTGQVAIIDTASNAVTAQIPVASPHNIAVHPDGMLAYVASQTPQKPALAIINLNRNAIFGNVPLDKVPRALNFSPDGRHLYFTQAGVDAVQILNTANNRISGHIAVGSSPHHVIFLPRGPALVVSQGPGTLEAISPASDALEYTIPVGTQPHWIAIGPGARTAYVSNEGDNTVAVVDLSGKRVTARIAVGNRPRKIDIQPAGAQKSSAAAPRFHHVAAQQTEVVVKGFSFTPAEAEVPAGQRLTWTNRDTVTHALTGAKGEWASGDLAPGAHYTHVFTRPGTYEYVCSIHPYMQGKVVVK